MKKMVIELNPGDCFFKNGYRYIYLGIEKQTGFNEPMMFNLETSHLIFWGILGEVEMISQSVPVKELKQKPKSTILEELNKELLEVDNPLP